MEYISVWAVYTPFPVLSDTDDSNRVPPVSVFYSSSLRLSSATRTASTTNAENVQSRPRIDSSTSSIISSGNRMLLFVECGVMGILNFRMMVKPPRI